MKIIKSHNSNLFEWSITNITYHISRSLSFLFSLSWVSSLCICLLVPFLSVEFGQLQHRSRLTKNNNTPLLTGFSIGLVECYLFSISDALTWLRRGLSSPSLSSGQPSPVAPPPGHSGWSRPSAPFLHCSVPAESSRAWRSDQPWHPPQQPFHFSPGQSHPWWGGQTCQETSRHVWVPGVELSSGFMDQLHWYMYNLCKN